MKKRLLGKPGTMLYPVPVVMVSCSDGTKDNIITVAWTGIVNSEPPILSVSIRKSRLSHSIIEKSREFVVNLTTEALVSATDFCGVRSGRDLDKFETLSLTKLPASVVNCPMIGESPVNIECRVRDVIEFPSHDVFFADIVAVHAGEDLFNREDKFELEKAGLLCFSHGGYFGVKQETLGRFGFSVMKPKTKKRLKKAAGSKRV
ncbi:MAG: flavin reductase family protein [Firmicutes bacterium HGW-Firmicutes-11]|jgi:flavin reductase (DIM6/NTAB) family NADH-FMN oxidoreductase RutF|nr:MAG: flavin reductase family protein [Firmicutes bacterium HGW-Firmicutes-11]